MEIYITKISHPENLYQEGHVKYKHPYFLQIATFFSSFGLFNFTYYNLVSF